MRMGRTEAWTECCRLSGLTGQAHAVIRRGFDYYVCWIGSGGESAAREVCAVLGAKFVKRTYILK